MAHSTHSVLVAMVMVSAGWLHIKTGCLLIMGADFAILTLMHNPCFAIHSVQNYAKIMRNLYQNDPTDDQHKSEKNDTQNMPK